MTRVDIDILDPSEARPPVSVGLHPAMRLVDSISPPPDWLVNHPEVIARQFVPDDVLKPYCVWRAKWEPERTSVTYVVKIIGKGSAEGDIYNALHMLPRVPANHVLPCDVITQAERPFLIMPNVHRSLSSVYEKRTLPLLDMLYQIIEGLEFLHNHRYVHMDLYPTNMLISQTTCTEPYELEKDRVYIIDFGTSRHFPEGPGRQGPVTLPEAHYGPPPDMKTFDPYSWDVYCAGRTIQSVLKLTFCSSGPPWLLRRYTEWLIGTEKGCTGVCRCRPSARRARQVLAVMRSAVRLWMMLVQLKPLRLLLRPAGPVEASRASTRP